MTELKVFLRLPFLFVVLFLSLLTGCSSKVLTPEEALKEMNGLTAKIISAVEQRRSDLGVAFPLDNNGKRLAQDQDFHRQLMKKGGEGGPWKNWKGPYLDTLKVPVGLTSQLVYAQGKWPFPVEKGSGISTTAKEHIYLQINGPTREEWSLIENYYDWGFGRTLQEKETSGRVILRSNMILFHVMDVENENYGSADPAGFGKIVQKIPGEIQSIVDGIRRWKKDMGTLCPLTDKGEPNTGNNENFQLQLKEKLGRDGLWKRWNGPYLSTEPTLFESAYGAQLVIFNVAGSAGYDLDGDGIFDTLNNRVVHMGILGIPREVWAALDEKLDAKLVRGSEKARENSGRVIWHSGSIYILLATDKPEYTSR